MHFLLTFKLKQLFFQSDNVCCLQTASQDRSLGERKLNSGILGASVANLSITGLKDDVVIHLRNKEPIPVSLFSDTVPTSGPVRGCKLINALVPFPKLQEDFKAVCVFWDFAFNSKVLLIFFSN